MTKYLVFIDGAGDYGDYLHVVSVEALNAQEAVETVTSPSWGYGRQDDGIAYVAYADEIDVFRINDTRRKTVTRTTLDELTP